ncbi:MAG: condensation domain-containing protein [Jatrophihabitantaceae bacterium]
MSEHESVPAPLTFGQLVVWRDVDALPRSRWHEGNWVFSADVPAGVGAASVRAAVDRLAERHGVLRTTYDVSDPARPTQRVRELAELPLDFQTVSLDSAAAVQEASERLRLVPFDLRSQRPYRALLVDSPGARTLLISKHHIAVDAWSMGLLSAELTMMFDGADDALPPLSEDVCALAFEQRSAAWQRRREASERHYRTVLGAPAARFRELNPAPGTMQGYFESARLHTAASRIAHECRVSLSSVLISAYALAVSKQCTELPIRMAVMSSNRFSQRWAGLVTTLNQMVAITVEVEDNCLQRPALEAVQARSLRAYRLAIFDYDAMRPASLGLPPDIDPTPTCMFNIVASWVCEPTSPIQDGDVPDISWEPVFTSLGPRCHLRVYETTRGTLIPILRTTGISEAVNVEISQRMYSTIIQAGERAVAVRESLAGT